MRVVPVFVLLVLMVFSSFTIAASGRGDKMGDCPRGYDCGETPWGDLVPPSAVTGHTGFASFVLTRNYYSSASDDEATPIRFVPREDLTRSLLPSPDPVPTSQAQTSEGGSLVQAECVVWFDGKNLDVRPGGFFSDESGPFGASQDYDPGRALDSCVPGSGGAASPPHFGRPTDFAGMAGYFAIIEPETPWSPGSVDHGEYAVVVEKGDCNPASGRDFRYRGHLDFVDPNGIYHEVQEYDYVCGGTLDRSGPAGNRLPGGQGIASGATADVVKELFPLTYTDPQNEWGCEVYSMPGDPSPGAVDTGDPLNSTGPTLDPMSGFNLGHKCNGSVQDLFTERMWITQVHEPVWDPAVRQYYTFALVFDTCSGRNVDEGWDRLGSDRESDALDRFLDDLGMSQPLMEVCHDGSSFSFDDHGRGRTTHAAPPESKGSEEIMRGNAFEFDLTAPNAGMHRTNCRHSAMAWDWNDHPGRRGPVGLDCYPEDHKTSSVDIYVFDLDPTGLFLANSNGSTGQDAYVNDPPTGPGWVPS